ncbi:mucin-2 [Sarcoptes scabiei]|nr:mucin-2 [Sarcoptes scabiei]
MKLARFFKLHPLGSYIEREREKRQPKLLILIDKNKMIMKPSLIFIWIIWIISILIISMLIVSIIIYGYHLKFFKTKTRKNGIWSERIDEIIDPLQCLSNIFEDSIQDIDLQMSCCRYELMKSWIENQIFTKCSKISFKNSTFRMFAFVRRYLDQTCENIDINTFSCQMMFLMFENN